MTFLNHVERMVLHFEKAFGLMHICFLQRMKTLLLVSEGPMFDVEIWN